MIFGFDIEVAKFPAPETGKHWRDIAPLGVTCATLVDPTGTKGMIWYSAPGRMTMSREACWQMMEYLLKLSKQGHKIVTWNGVGFDFGVLGYEVNDLETAKGLALTTYDPMFGVFKTRGFPISLNNACIGMRIEGKLEGMSGAEAVNAWSNPLRRPLVLQYCIQDSHATAQLGVELQRKGRLTWKKKDGGLAETNLPFVPSLHYYKLPMANQSWMKKGKPLRLEDVTGWM